MECSQSRPPFFSYVSHADRTIVEAPLTPTGRLDIDSIGEAITRVQASGRRCVVLLCNPHNLTGTVHTRSELESLARVARVASIRVISDEIHGPLVLPGATFIPYLTVTNSENAIAERAAHSTGSTVSVHSNLLVYPQECDQDARQKLGDRAFAATYRKGQGFGFDVGISYALHEQLADASRSDQAHRRD
ncbi:hypothetical protein H351_30615 (plasmid) [Rhodococcus erythropolis R138]|uniref:aminotransferase class I/II-fold pyridoxal phosphate-dependent enzyme n=1 Tax=Rhodococcus erythropolis TaxID=1833 RepID=UPI0006924C86|nr:hypothetical protein H351_30615 [Rhodococcus erythropolis R138]